jgi:sulfate adenylyltransferase
LALVEKVCGKKEKNMTSSRKNKTIYIDQEAASALELVSAGLLNPVGRLMNEKEADEVAKTGMIHGKTFPFPFILAPAGKKNQKVIQTLKKGEKVTLVCCNKPFAILEIDDVYAIDPTQRLIQIYGTTDTSHPGIQATLKRLGNYGKKSILRR